MHMSANRTEVCTRNARTMGSTWSLTLKKLTVSCTPQRPSAFEKSKRRSKFMSDKTVNKAVQATQNFFERRDDLDQITSLRVWETTTDDEYAGNPFEFREELEKNADELQGLVIEQQDRFDIVIRRK